MGRNKEPTSLLVAKGKSHIGKEEIEERKKQELEVPFKEIIVPKFLTKKSQKNKFIELAKKLKAIDIYTELDADVLGRYIIASENYIKYSKLVSKTIGKNIDLNKHYMEMQDKTFKQCMTIAKELGLTISSRCKIIVPNQDEKQKPVNKFERFKNKDRFTVN